jgi:hypothetical protein
MSDFNPNSNFTDTNLNTDANAISFNENAGPITTVNAEPIYPENAEPIYPVNAEPIDNKNNFVEPFDENNYPEPNAPPLEQQPAIDPVKFNKLLNAVSLQSANDLTLLKKLLDKYPDIINNKETWNKAIPLINQLLQIYKGDNLVEGMNKVEEDAGNSFENLLFGAFMLGPLVGGKKRKTKKRIGKGKGKGNRHKKSKRHR